MADKARTQVYTGDYVAESEALTAARTSYEMSASPVSPGTGAALRMLALCLRHARSWKWARGAGVSACGCWTAWLPTASLTTIDSESELLGHARRNFAAAGLSSSHAPHRRSVPLDMLAAHGRSRLFMVAWTGDLEETPPIP